MSGAPADAQAGRTGESPNEALAAAGDLYFRDGGTRAGNLDVELTGIDYIAAKF
ncbi:hypothetical protein [Streptomyces sp. NPDC056405]|uniref:hypothetical protein n=1 Tax=Streptomyces sp. NPDC056405 TaxID=3345811 RepID=UPI0035DADC87